MLTSLFYAIKIQEKTPSISISTTSPNYHIFLKYNSLVINIPCILWNFMCYKIQLASIKQNVGGSNNHMCGNLLSADMSELSV